MDAFRVTATALDGKNGKNFVRYAVYLGGGARD